MKKWHEYVCIYLYFVFNIWLWRNIEAINLYINTAISWN